MTNSQEARALPSCHWTKRSWAERRIGAAIALTLLRSLAPAQEAEDRTLLNWKQMRAIIDEASGERAMHHLLELVPYQRNA